MRIKLFFLGLFLLCVFGLIQKIEADSSREIQLGTGGLATVLIHDDLRYESCCTALLTYYSEFATREPDLDQVNKMCLENWTESSSMEDYNTDMLHMYLECLFDLDDHSRGHNISYDLKSQTFRINP